MWKKYRLFYTTNYYIGWLPDAGQNRMPLNTRAILVVERTALFFMFKIKHVLHIHCFFTKDTPISFHRSSLARIIMIANSVKAASGIATNNTFISPVKIAMNKPITKITNGISTYLSVSFFFAIFLS